MTSVFDRNNTSEADAACADMIYGCVLPFSLARPRQVSVQYPLDNSALDNSVLIVIRSKPEGTNGLRSK
jgi:hypothetical protein